MMVGTQPHGIKKAEAGGLGGQTTLKEGGQVVETTPWGNGMAWEQNPIWFLSEQERR